MSAPVAFERPDRYPRANASQNLDDWEKYVEGSLARETASAEKWRTGLAGFVTIITTALIVQGPASIDDISAEWRWLVILLLTAGMISAVIAAWVAQSAAAPSSSGLEQLDEVVEKWGSVRGYEVAQAAQSARRLKSAKTWMVVSIGALVLGVVALWVVPGSTSSNLIEVETPSQVYCGELRQIADDKLTIGLSDGESRKVSVASIVRYESVESCGD